MPAFSYGDKAIRVAVEHWERRDGDPVFPL
jgi:hypothetical protein